ncbi:MAG: PepSY domain-containing protein [Kiritimatiellae bacterium]|nr:PepSY domain-containing protein [Kiritimatiellia bacterium]
MKRIIVTSFALAAACVAVGEANQPQSAANCCKASVQNVQQSCCTSKAKAAPAQACHTCCECTKAAKPEAKCPPNCCQSAAIPSNNGFIGRQAAIRAALAHAKFHESDVRWLKCELDREDGVMVYEVDFKKDGFEYDYDIDAKTGTVIKAKKERD